MTESIRFWSNITLKVSNVIKKKIQFIISLHATQILHMQQVLKMSSRDAQK